MPATGTTSPRHGTPKRPDPARVNPSHQHRILAGIHPEPLHHTLTDAAVAPAGVLAGQPADQGLDVPPGRRSAGPAAYRPRRPAPLEDVPVPAHDRLRGNQQPQPLAARFRYDAEQGREQGPVRPGQLRAVRLMASQNGELMAQKQNLGGLSRLLTPRQPQQRDHPRDQQEHEPVGLEYSITTVTCNSS